MVLAFSNLLDSASAEFPEPYNSEKELGAGPMSPDEVCRTMKLPWIVHFRGFDASVRSVLDRHRERYRLLLQEADAIVAVSRSIQSTLLELGAPAAKLHYNPSGADCCWFTPGNPGTAPPIFVSVGRMVDKKAPQLTIRAFAEVYRKRQHARLRMIGDQSEAVGRPGSTQRDFVGPIERVLRRGRRGGRRGGQIERGGHRRRGVDRGGAGASARARAAPPGERGPGGRSRREGQHGPGRDRL